MKQVNPPSEERNHQCVPCNAKNLWLLRLPLNTHIIANCKFDNKRPCILSTHCLYVFRTVLTISSDNFSCTALIDWSFKVKQKEISVRYEVNI